MSQITANLDLATVSRMDRATFTAALGQIFEHSPWVATQAWASRPFASVEELHRAMSAVVKQAARAEQLALLNAHPDLAGREAQEGTMTDSSKVEQAGAGLNALTRQEMARITELNAEYRRKHGFPFIVCVRHYTKEGIFFEFARRLANDTETELTNGLEQVFAIAGLRLNTLFTTTGEKRP